MPRKKTPSGRSRGRTQQASLYRKLNKANQMLRSLERAGNFNTYGSKTLVRFVQSNPNLQLKTSRNRSKRKYRRRKDKYGRQLNKMLRGQRSHTIVLTKKNLSAQELRAIVKHLDRAIKSSDFTNIGIERIREKQRESTRVTLGLENDREITDSEVEAFQEVIKYNYVDIIDKIGESEFYSIVLEAKDNGYTVDRWIEVLSNYVEINNDVMRKQAEMLYNKFVA